MCFIFKRCPMTHCVASLGTIEERGGIWKYSARIFGGKRNVKPQWLSVLRRRSEVARLLRLWVRIPPATWMSLCCECCVCVLSGRGLCDELITRYE